MGLLLTIVGAWLVLSIPVGVGVGRFILGRTVASVEGGRLFGSTAFDETWTA